MSGIVISLILTVVLFIYLIGGFNDLINKQKIIREAIENSKRKMMKERDEL